MQLCDFDFELPEELIAQEPIPQRDSSRLLCLDRCSGTIVSRQFVDIIEAFRPGDVLVVNNTRVIPARLFATKSTGGRVEVLLVRRCAQSCAFEEWICLTRSSKPLKVGTKLNFEAGVTAEVIALEEDALRRLRFDCAGDFLDTVEQIGHLPLPPYIKRPDAPADRTRYQTVFATEKGAVAAPTAALHFTDEILARLAEKGVTICDLTLHVGLGTFLPVRVDDIREHRMHAEYFSVPQATAALINSARQTGRRIVALGTTVTRTLETVAADDGTVQSGQGESEIFIYPGYHFKAVDALITNFHLPKSTLLMLVSAFAGRDFVLEAYRQAVAESYRFFSYGDCMMIT